MKKIFTLFMATVVALSVSALPLNIKTDNGQVKQPTELSLLKQARMEQMVARLAAPALERQAPVKKAEAKMQIPMAPALQAKVAQEEKVVELSYDDIAFGPVYYEETEDWTIILSTNDEYSPAYGYMIQLDWYAPADNCYGTFTTEDFSSEYTFMNTSFSMGSIFFSEIEMTFAAEKVSDNLEVITLEATLKGGTDGFDSYPTFKISVKKENIVAKSYVDIAIEDATLEENETGFVIAGKNEDIDFAVAVANAYGIVGDYTNMSAFDLENTKVTYKGKEITPIQMTLNVELGESATGNMAYINSINLMGNDTIQYNINAIAPLPAPTDTVEITCTNLKVDDSYVAWMGTIDMQASNDDYTLYGAWYATSIEEGTYSGADATLTLIPNTDEYISIASLNATITVSLDENERWAVEATMLGDDNVWYVLHLSYYIPSQTDTVVVEFGTSAKARYYPNMDNDLMLFNENELYYAALNVKGIYMGDAFNADNMDMDYSGLRIYSEVDSMLMPVEIATIEDGLLEQVGDTTKMKADIYTFEGTLYQVKLWYVPAVPTEEVTVVYDNVQFVNNMDYGYYSLLAFSPDSSEVMMISVYAYGEDYIAGEFVNEGLFGEGRYDIIGMESYYGIWSEDMYMYEMSYLDKGEILVEMDEEKNITLKGWIVCENAVKYNVTMKSKYAKPALDYDTDGEAVERTYTADDELVVVDQTADYGSILLQVYSMDTMDEVLLYILSATTDADIVVPEGTYPINNSWEYGTVVASTGVDYEGNAQPSFYATMYEWDGLYYLDLPYFMVEGTVEVKKNEDKTMYLEINAVNSYNVPIHIVYDGFATGVENTQAKQTKCVKKLVDGQLMIIRNGETYNVVGARVK